MSRAKTNNEKSKSMRNRTKKKVETIERTKRVSEKKKPVKI